MSARIHCLGCRAPVAASAGRPVVLGTEVGVICQRCSVPPAPRSPAPASSAAEPPAADARRQRLRTFAAGADRIARVTAQAGVRAAASLKDVCRRESTHRILGAFALSSALLLLVASPVDAPMVGHRLLSVSAESSTSTRALARLQVAAPEAERRHPLSVGREGEVPVWYHPLATQDRLLPGRASRRFGATRPGDRPEECGAGHCGVDLAGEPGTVIHAARPGRVSRIVRDPDRPSGRYVRLEHDAGFASTYMHLGRIHPELVVGVEVAAGEPLGTLGSTGIEHSPPHLHFAVMRIDNGRQRFVNPAPMLREAVLLQRPAPFPEEVDPGVD